MWYRVSTYLTQRVNNLGRFSPKFGQELSVSSDLKISTVVSMGQTVSRFQTNPDIECNYCNTTVYCLKIQNYPNIKLNAYHMKIRDCACFKALAAKLFDFPSYVCIFLVWSKPLTVYVLD